MCGLFVSGIFSASLSTISSAVTSLSAVTLEDYLKPLYKAIFKRTLVDSKSTLPTKIVACIFGLLCIGLAFVAGSMGGVLQASLTIFGVVGGPLLAIFTLGVCTTRTNQRGVLLGFLVSLIVSFWMGFGGPKPSPVTLEFSTSGCENATALLADAIELSANSSPVVIEPHYFWLYRISYLWLSVIGFLIAVAVGYGSSIVLAHFGWAENAEIYLDKYQKELDYDLFAPMLSRRWRRQAEQRKQTAQDETLTKLTQQ